MANFEPRKILGNWRIGYALDVHTLSSEFLGYNEFGHAEFKTNYSEIGGLLYRLKSKNDSSVITEIVRAVTEFIKNPAKIDILIPVPASTQRKEQPVLLLANAISKEIGVPVVDCVTKTRHEPQLKNIFDSDERTKRLEGLHQVDQSAVADKRILLFDDLYRSGATMNAIATELYDKGAADVLALTITKTRSNQ